MKLWTTTFLQARAYEEVVLYGPFSLLFKSFRALFLRGWGGLGIKLTNHLHHVLICVKLYLRFPTRLHDLHRDTYPLWRTNLYTTEALYTTPQHIGLYMGTHVYRHFDGWTSTDCRHYSLVTFLFQATTNSSFIWNKQM